MFDTVFFKVNHLGTLRFLEKSFFCQDVNDFIHLIIVEGFTIVAIKRNTEFIVKTVEFHQAFVTEPLPEGSCFLVTSFQFTEPFTSFFVYRWVFFSFGIDTHIKLKEFIDRVGFDSFLATPFLIGNNQHTKLFTPVTQVVDTDWFVALFSYDVGKSISDNC